MNLRIVLAIALLVSPLQGQDPQKYQGGTGDGYKLVRSAITFLDGTSLPTTRYQGGDGDGYDFLNSSKSFLDGTMPLTARYQGGSDDGYDLLRSSKSFLDGSILTVTRYQGGSGDGYDLVASGTFSLIPGLVFSVQRATGDVFALGSFISGGADLAERINVSEPVEPGDVVKLDPEKPHYYRKAHASSRAVAGVITGKPGFVLGNGSEESEGLVVNGEWSADKNQLLDVSGQLLETESAERPMMALMGRVPVKATTENGAIRPGDLLTVSSRPGYAMRCTVAKGCEGAIIGKALEGLERGEGLVLVLVMSH